MRCQKLVQENKRVNSYSFGNHLLIWLISANFRFSLRLDLKLSWFVRSVPEADVLTLRCVNQRGAGHQASGADLQGFTRDVEDCLSGW